MQKEPKFKNSFDNLDFNSVKDVNQIFIKLAFKDYLIFTVVLSFVVLLLSVLYGNPFPLLVLCLYAVIVSVIARESFFKNFVKENNLKHSAEIPRSEVKGNLFKVHRANGIGNVIYGSFEDKKARFFTFSYDVGNGDSKRAIYFSVIEIFFDDLNFPHILLRPKVNFFFNRRHGVRGKNERSLHLESEFSDDFEIFFTDGYGIEVMNIFSKDFLRFLQKEKLDFSIELAEDRVYVYTNKMITKKSDLKELFETSKKIVKKINPMIKSTKNYFSAMKNYR